MRKTMMGAGSAGMLLAAATSLSGCVNVSSMDCAEIADQAKRISESQPIQIRNVTNAQETSRNESEARCTATVELSDGRSTTVYPKAYEEGSNTMVAYQETQFE